MTDAVTTMCTDEDDEVFECEDNTPNGADNTNNRRTQSLSSLSQPGGPEKVCILHCIISCNRFPSLII